MMIDQLVHYVYADSGIIPYPLTTADIDGQPCCIMHICQNYFCARCNGSNSIFQGSQNYPAFANDSGVITFKNDNDVFF